MIGGVGVGGGDGEEEEEVSGVDGDGQVQGLADALSGGTVGGRAWGAGGGGVGVGDRASGEGCAGIQGARLRLRKQGVQTPEWNHR